MIASLSWHLSMNLKTPLPCTDPEVWGWICHNTSFGNVVTFFCCRAIGFILNCTTNEKCCPFIYHILPKLPAQDPIPEMRTRCFQYIKWVRVADDYRLGKTSGSVFSHFPNLSPQNKMKKRLMAARSCVVSLHPLPSTRAH